MLSHLASRLWFPLAVVTAVTAQMSSSHRSVETDDGVHATIAEMTAPLTDTVKYRKDGYKMFWTEEEMNATFTIDDSLLNQGGEFGEMDELDVVVRPAALDSLIPPDSLLQLDTFRYKYYAALRDSLCHRFVRDSLIEAGDSLDWPRLDSLYTLDSIAFADAKYWEWYATLDKKERKKADFERLMPLKQKRLDSLKAAKDSIQAVKDSILETTPRILETFALKDSLRYQRIVKWTHEQDFHNINLLSNEDTTYNYRIYDYPFMREDVNATWLGVAGSPVQYFDFSKRRVRDGVSFYEAQESWSYDPETLPMYNTKTPYTELAYFGTLFAGTSKESDNLHIMTTQNVTPEFNFTLGYDRFGGAGILARENTKNKTAYVAGNYLGKRYLMHAGYIYNMVARNENGGIEDNFFIRDTTIDAREAAVRLSNASSKIKKNTLFLDQQYRIPFSAIADLFRKKDKHIADTLDASLPGLDGMPLDPDAQTDPDAQAADPDALASDAAAGQAPNVPGPPPGVDPDDPYADAEPPSDSVAVFTTDGTTAFIGHSTEYSVYSRTYQDVMSSNSEKAFYNNVFNYSPSGSYDSLRVSKFDNRLFLRLQPWSDEGVISKLDVGVGEKLMSYYSFDPSYIHRPSNYHWNATYLYAGAEGQYKKYLDWNARGHYTLLGDEANDFDVSADARINLFPFRRDKQSPLVIKAHFSTTLDEPEYYTTHLFTNHFAWDNDFRKISTTQVGGSISVPKWKLGAEFTYSLLANNIYYDTLGIVRQNASPMSILSLSMYKNFSIGKLVHLDHKALFQLSSNEDVVPLPMVALNARYYLQFAVGENDALHIQLGVNAWYNTAWYAPSWNPALGVFHNQKEFKYGNAPYFDAFANMQWKRACIFVKWENAGMGWPLDKADYFSANHYIRTQRVVKLGIYWPFYTQPSRDTSGDRGPNPDL